MFGLLLVVSWAPLAAQDVGAPRATLWGSAGVGEAFIEAGGDFGVFLEGTYQVGPTMLALRLASASAITTAIVTAISGEPGETAVRDLALLYGRATPPGEWHGSVAVGLGVAWADRDSAGTKYTESDLTIPVEVQAMWAPSRYVGLVLCAFASFNDLANFGGVTVGLALGRLR
jgi:hypothetical protein